MTAYCCHFDSPTTIDAFLISAPGQVHFKFLLLENVVERAVSTIPIRPTSSRAVLPPIQSTRVSSIISPCRHELWHYSPLTYHQSHSETRGTELEAASHYLKPATSRYLLIGRIPGMRLAMLLFLGIPLMSCCVSWGSTRRSLDNGGPTANACYKSKWPCRCGPNKPPSFSQDREGCEREKGKGPSNCQHQHSSPYL